MPIYLSCTLLLSLSLFAFDLFHTKLSFCPLVGNCCILSSAARKCMNKFRLHTHCTPYPTCCSLTYKFAQFARKKNNNNKQELETFILVFVCVFLSLCAAATNAASTEIVVAGAVDFSCCKFFSCTKI